MQRSNIAMTQTSPQKIHKNYSEIMGKILNNSMEKMGKSKDANFFDFDKPMVYWKHLN